jgi:Cu+-exporting ATPase
MNTILKSAAVFSLVLFLSCKGNQNSSQNSQADSTAAAADTTRTSTVYTCPMHPEIVSDKPGTCPTCGMALEPKS